MVGVIIQARMGSSRLPGKILMDFEGRSLLQHIIVRLKKLKQNVKIVIATSVLEKDDKVEAFCKQEKIDCFRGDENNVLKRYYECATLYGFRHVVRMTGDNPLPDIEELDKLIDFHIKNEMDFSENFSVLPIGVGMEIMSYDALEQSVNSATLPKHFEHADEYILDNLEKFKHATVETEQKKNHPHIRLTVDTGDDYDKLCYIIRNAGEGYITTEKAIELGILYDKLHVK